MIYFSFNQPEESPESQSILHAVQANPPSIATGQVGAVGQIHLICIIECQQITMYNFGCHHIGQVIKSVNFNHQRTKGGIMIYMNKMLIYPYIW